MRYVRDAQRDCQNHHVKIDSPTIPHSHIYTKFVVVGSVCSLLLFRDISVDIQLIGEITTDISL